MISHRELLNNTAEIEKKIEPGYCVHSERQTGKTVALLNLIHRLHKGGVLVVALNQDQSHRIKRMYIEMFPNDFLIQTCSYESFRLDGHDTPVYCDEWFRFSEKAQDELRLSGRVKGAVGTVLPVQKFRL